MVCKNLKLEAHKGSEVMRSMQLLKVTKYSYLAKMMAISKTLTLESKF